jgi:hypothetical protein
VGASILVLHMKLGFKSLAMFEPCSVHVVYVWEDLSFCDELSFTLSLLFF